MKLTKLLSASLLALFLIGRAVAAGHENGNAGDTYAIEFRLTARDVVQRLRMLPQADLQGVNLNKLSSAIASTVVSSEERVFLNGFEVNAKNRPEDNVIIVNRSWWREVRMPSETRNRMRLVLHEYLPMINIDDQGAKVSERLIALLDIKNYDPNRWWNPLNPANHLSMQLEVDGTGCELPSIEFNLQESEEKFDVETSGNCRPADYRKIQIRKSSYSAPPSSGYRGTVHLFQITVLNSSDQQIGSASFRPKIGECLAPDEGTCSLGGSLFLANVSFQFWLLRDQAR